MNERLVLGACIALASIRSLTLSATTVRVDAHLRQVREKVCVYEKVLACLVLANLYVFSLHII